MVWLQKMLATFIWFIQYGTASNFPFWWHDLIGSLGYFSFAMWVIVGRQPHTRLTEVWGEDYVHIYSNNWRLDLAELEKECLSQVVVKRDILSREYSCTIYCWFDHCRTWEIVSFLLLFHWLYFLQFLSCRALLVWMVRESTCPLV